MPVARRPRIRRRRARACRRARARDRGAPASQCRTGRGRVGDACRGTRNSAGVGAELFWRWRTAASGQLGKHAVPGAVCARHRSVARALSRSVHLRDCPFRECRWRTRSMNRLYRFTITLVAAIAAAAVTSSALPQSNFSSLVDEYLDQFALRHPSIAAGNGIHDHDDRLEDFSVTAVAAEIAWLRAFASRLDAVRPTEPPADERVDHRILRGIVDGWILDLDSVRTWTRNPMIYAAAISDGVHNLMTMESSPIERRRDQATAKLRLLPRLLASARHDLRNTPRVSVERGS